MRLVGKDAASLFSRLDPPPEPLPMAGRYRHPTFARPCGKLFCVRHCMTGWVDAEGRLVDGSSCVFCDR